MGVILQSMNKYSEAICTFEVFVMVIQKWYISEDKTTVLIYSSANSREITSLAGITWFFTYKTKRLLQLHNAFYQTA